MNSPVVARAHLVNLSRRQETPLDFAAQVAEESRPFLRFVRQGLPLLHFLLCFWVSFSIDHAKDPKLVELCLAQIEKHNHASMKLNAVLSTAPKAELLKIASALDEERFTTGPRGPLHGIPVLLKVVTPKSSRTSLTDICSGHHLHSVFKHGDHSGLICPQGCCR